MRLLLGIVLGAVITVGAAYIYDTRTTGPTTTTGSATAAVDRPMVNWDVVGNNWILVQRRAREAWTALSHKVSS